MKLDSSEFYKKYLNIFSRPLQDLFFRNYFFKVLKNSLTELS